MFLNILINTKREDGAAVVAIGDVKHDKFLLGLNVVYNFTECRSCVIFIRGLRRDNL